MTVDMFRKSETKEEEEEEEEEEGGSLVTHKANQCLFLRTCCIDLFDWVLFIGSQNWERCEAGLADSMMQLKDMKTRLNQSMPDSDEELQSAEKFNKVQIKTHRRH